MDNFTVTIVSFPVAAGADFSISNPTAVLLLEPLVGYAINASNFTATSPLPNYVSGVVFTQSGANIECTITYLSPSIMPTANVFVDVCATGYAEEAGVTVSGTFNQCGVTNTSLPTPGQGAVAYSGSGNFGESLMVYTQTVTSTSGFYFETMPILAVTTGNINDYAISSTKTYNPAGQLTQVVFKVTYTFTDVSASGDSLCLTANASEIYNPTVEITSYTYPYSTFDQGGQTTSFTVFGITGADYALNVTTSGGTSIYSTSGIISSTGSATLSITIPSVSAEECYTFTLTGDLAASFDTSAGQPSFFTMCQFVETTLDFNFVTTLSNITVVSNTSRSFIPFSIQPTVPYSYTVVASSSEPIILISTPPVTAWTNQGGGYTPSDPTYNQVVNPSSTYVIDNVSVPRTLTANLLVTVNQAGSIDMTSILDLDTYVEALTPIQLYYGTVAEAACCVGIIGNYILKGGSTFLTATSILNSDGTAIIDGYYAEVT